MLSGFCSSKLNIPDITLFSYKRSSPGRRRRRSNHRTERVSPSWCGSARNAEIFFSGSESELTETDASSTLSAVRERNMPAKPGTPTALQEIDDRLSYLTRKVDKVTGLTYKMLNKSTYLNNNSRHLKDKVQTLQHDVYFMNETLKKS